MSEDLVLLAADELALAAAHQDLGA